MANSPIRTFTITADNLFNKDSDPYNCTEVSVASYDYVDAYRRITALVHKVFTEADTVRYKVHCGLVDNTTCDERYTAVGLKEFQHRPLPATLEEFDAAEKNG